MTNIAFVFPGQGSQKVGMGKELSAAFPEARAVFAEVDDALGRKLSPLMFEGPEEELNRAENARPALVATGIAALRVLERQSKVPLSMVARFVAGHSLGEYTALCAAGSIPLDYTVRLVERTAKEMQQAVPIGSGAMAALWNKNGPIELSTLNELTKWAVQEGEVCSLAAHNAATQVVISGNTGAVERVMRKAKTELGWAGRTLKITVPAHCALMEFIATNIRGDLENSGFKNPVVPLVSNASARPESDASTIRDLLVFQLSNPVRWCDSVIAMRNSGVDTFVEFGSGNVLAKLVKGIDEHMSVHSLSGPKEIEDFIAGYRGESYSWTPSAREAARLTVA